MQILIGLCPFHDDKSPSLVVSPERNLWHCLGACQAGGSVIDWVMRSEGVSFRHAVELLRADAPLSTATKPVKVSTVRRLPAPVSTEADDCAALAQVADYYHATLKESPEALAYLGSRGLVSSEMVDHFRLGYANRTLGLRLPERNRKAGEELRGRLERLGVLRESGHEHLAGSLVVPLRDVTGGVVGMYGRKIRSDLKAGTPLHLYLPGPHRGVFNVEALRASKTMILCEALIDALTFWCAGFRNVASAYGIEGFTAELLEAFKRHGTEEVFIAFDRDEAGDRGAEKVAATLIEAGVTCRRVEFPKGMDVNDYALRMKPATKAFEVALAGARLMGHGKGRATSAPASPSAAPPPLTSAPPASSAAAPSPLPASPAPAPLSAAAEIDGDEVRFAFGDRRYRVRGLARNTSFDSLRVQPSRRPRRALPRGHAGHLQRAAARCVREAGGRGAGRGGGRDQGRRRQGAAQAGGAAGRERARGVQAEDGGAGAHRRGDGGGAGAARRSAPARPHRGRLRAVRRGGRGDKQAGRLHRRHLAEARRALGGDHPEPTAAGKSSLMEAVLAFVPEEERVKYSAMTGQSLFYMGETELGP